MVFRVLVALAAVGVLFPVPALAQRMPRGSFLKRTQTDASSFRRVVASDDRLTTLYSRAFAMPRDAVRRMVSGLHRTRLKSDVVTRVYYTRPGDRIGFKVRRVKAGTLVYADRSGAPRFVHVCGNPMRSESRISRLTPNLLVPDFVPTEQPNTEDFMASVNEPSDSIPGGIMPYAIDPEMPALSGPFVGWEPANSSASDAAPAGPEVSSPPVSPAGYSPAAVPPFLPTGTGAYSGGGSSTKPTTGGSAGGIAPNGPPAPPGGGSTSPGGGPTPNDPGDTNETPEPGAVLMGVSALLTSSLLGLRLRRRAAQ